MSSRYWRLNYLFCCVHRSRDSHFFHLAGHHKNCPFPWVISTPSNNGSSARATQPLNGISIGSAVFAGHVYVTNKQRYTDKQTDRPRYARRRYQYAASLTCWKAGIIKWKFHFVSGRKNTRTWFFSSRELTLFYGWTFRRDGLSTSLCQRGRCDLEWGLTKSKRFLPPDAYVMHTHSATYSTATCRSVRTSRWCAVSKRRWAIKRSMLDCTNCNMGQCTKLT